MALCVAGRPAAPTRRPTPRGAAPPHQDQGPHPEAFGNRRKVPEGSEERSRPRPFAPKPHALCSGSRDARWARRPSGGVHDSVHAQVHALRGSTDRVRSGAAHRPDQRGVRGARRAEAGRHHAAAAERARRPRHARLRRGGRHVAGDRAGRAAARRRRRARRDVPADRDAAHERRRAHARARARGARHHARRRGSRPSARRCASGWRSRRSSRRSVSSSPASRTR